MRVAPGQLLEQLIGPAVCYHVEDACQMLDIYFDFSWSCYVSVLPVSNLSQQCFIKCHFSQTPANTLSPAWWVTQGRAVTRDYSTACCLCVAFRTSKQLSVPLLCPASWHVPWDPLELPFRAAEARRGRTPGLPRAPPAPGRSAVSRRPLAAARGGPGAPPGPCSGGGAGVGQVGHWANRRGVGAAQSNGNTRRVWGKAMTFLAIGD